MRIFWCINKNDCINSSTNNNNVMNTHDVIGSVEVARNLPVGISWILHFSIYGLIPFSYFIIIQFLVALHMIQKRCTYVLRILNRTRIFWNLIALAAVSKGVHAAGSKTPPPVLNWRFQLNRLTCIITELVGLTTMHIDSRRASSRAHGQSSGRHCTARQYGNSH